MDAPSTPVLQALKPYNKSDVLVAISYNSPSYGMLLGRTYSHSFSDNETLFSTALLSLATLLDALRFEGDGDTFDDKDIDADDDDDDAFDGDKDEEVEEEVVASSL